MEKPGYRDSLGYLMERYPNKDFFTAQEVADMMGKDLDTVYGDIKKKKNPLPARKMGRNWVIATPMLARWMCGV